MSETTTSDDRPAPPPPPPQPTSSGGHAGPVAEHGTEHGGGGVPFAGLRLAALLGALALLGFWNPWMLVVIVALVVMITLHELGHYLTAKRAGMKVTEFFLFFGPKIWSIQRGETEYGIKCIPAGAYVKIIGMHNLEEVPPEDEGRTYRQKSFGQRVSVAVAGSTMHFILALVLVFASLAFVGQPAGSLDPAVQQAAWTIGSVEPGTGAAAAGLEPGDRVTRIDGQDIASFDELRTVSRRVKGETVPVVYERDGRTIETDITLTPFYSWYVERLVDGSGPAEAGLEVGDELTSIGGTDLRDLADPNELLASLEGDTVPVTVERTSADGARQEAEAEILVENLVLAGSEGYLGVSVERAGDEKLGLGQALLETPQQFLTVMRVSVQSLGSFFSPSGISDFAGQVGDAQDENAGIEGPTVPTSDRTSATLLEAGSGPVGENRVLSIYGLVRIGADAGEVDPGGLIALFALVNIFIGVFNLTPLLPFDGGHVTIAVYEKIQERRLNRKRYFTDVARLMPLTYVVILAMLALFVSSLYLDIANPLT